MKSPNRFVKILAVSVFVLLIAGFVAYRSGVFMNEIPTPELPMQQGAAKKSRDTIPPPEITVLPSSKSLSPTIPIPVLSPEAPEFILDTAADSDPLVSPLETDQPDRTDSQGRIQSSNGIIMSGSKYAMVLRDDNYRLPDSLSKRPGLHFRSSLDSQKVIPYRNSTITTMPSSKSGYIFRPRIKIKPDTLRKQRP